MDNLIQGIANGERILFRWGVSNSGVTRTLEHCTNGQSLAEFFRPHVQASIKALEEIHPKAGNSQSWIQYGDGPRIVTSRHRKGVQR